MDIYQLATNYWDHTSEGGGDPADPTENPPFDPRPEVPSPDIPEETPPLERDPETPPVQPEPGIPTIEPIVPEVEPVREPGTGPGVPAFSL